jgi:hypothetical protein
VLRRAASDGRKIGEANLGHGAYLGMQGTPFLDDGAQLRHLLEVEHTVN